MIYIDIQIILILLNFVLLVILFFYSFYLFSLEKKVKAKYKDLTEKTAEIIESANHKAIDILQKSEFISDDLKSEISTNFDDILGHIKSKNYELYEKLKNDYEVSSSQVISHLQNEVTSEIEKISKVATETEKSIESKLQTELMDQRLKYEEERKKKLSSLEHNILGSIKDVLPNTIYTAIPHEVHEKIAKMLIDEALSKNDL